MYFELQPTVDDEQEVYANIKFYTEEALLRYIKEELSHEAIVFAYIGKEVKDSIHITKERLEEVRDEL